MNRKRPALPLALVCAAAALGTACTAAGTDKSGGGTKPTVLVLANNDNAGLNYAPAVARFVDQVATLSGGKLEIRVKSGWKGEGEGEPGVILDVAAGEAPLGWASTRAFDLAGVDAFQPLHAPFLINSYEAQAAVVNDPATQRLLDDLSPIGLTGLALAADELRFLAGAKKPLLEPEDISGLRIFTANSEIQTNALRALGAVPMTGRLPAAPPATGMGVETMWRAYQLNGLYATVPFVTANAVLWPRTVAIFANTEQLDALDEQSHGWILQAAQDAVTWSASHAADGEAVEVYEVCQFGTYIAEATNSQLAALRKAAEPVYVSLRAQPELANTLARIEELVGTSSPATSIDVPDDCRYRPGDETRVPPPARTLTGPGRTGDLPQGQYRYSHTEGELRAHNLNDLDAHANAGVFTWTFENGRWQYVQQPVDQDVHNLFCEGWYDVLGTTAVFTTTKEYAVGACGPHTWSARWSFTDGRLTWRAVNIVDFAYVWGGEPWQQID